MTSAPFQVHITHPQHTAQYQPDEEEEIAKNRRSKGELCYIYRKQNRGALSNKTVAGASTFGLRKPFD